MDWGSANGQVWEKDWAEEDGVVVRIRVCYTGSIETYGKTRMKGFGEGRSLKCERRAFEELVSCTEITAIRQSGKFCVTKYQWLNQTKTIVFR